MNAATYLDPDGVHPTSATLAHLAGILKNKIPMPIIDINAFINNRPFDHI